MNCWNALINNSISSLISVSCFIFLCIFSSRFIPRSCAVFCVQQYFPIPTLDLRRFASSNWRPLLFSISFSFFFAPLPHCVFSPLLSFFQCLYFPLFDLPFSIHKLTLSVRTAGVCTLISKLQQNCWINTDQLGNVPKEQTVYRHVINKTRTVRATKYRTLALK